MRVKKDCLAKNIIEIFVKKVCADKVEIKEKELVNSKEDFIKFLLDDENFNKAELKTPKPKLKTLKEVA